MVPQWHKIGVGPPQLEVQLEVLLQLEVKFSPGGPPPPPQGVSLIWKCPLFGSLPYQSKNSCAPIFFCPGFEWRASENGLRKNCQLEVKKRSLYEKLWIISAL